MFLRWLRSKEEYEYKIHTLNREIERLRDQLKRLEVYENRIKELKDNAIFKNEWISVKDALPIKNDFTYVLVCNKEFSLNMEDVYRATYSMRSGIFQHKESGLPLAITHWIEIPFLREIKD